MIKHICDCCGKEIDSALDGSINTVFPVYTIQVQEAPFVLPHYIDLCAHCRGIVRNNLMVLLQKETEL